MFTEKRFCCALFLIIVLSQILCQEARLRLPVSLEGYEIREIKKSDYYSSNWDLIIFGDRSIWMAYKIMQTDGGPVEGYITDILFFLMNNENKIFLGRFSLVNGFQDAFGQQFVINRQLNVNSVFMRKYFAGLSLGTIDDPFTIRGVAKLTTTGELYETEVMILLEISDSLLSIQQSMRRY